MWEISNTAQITGFFYSVLLGMCFCLFYDLLRSFRFAVKSTDFSVFLYDIFYFSVISVITFVFLLAVTNGELRGFVFLGILFGFLLFYFTVSRFLLKYLKSLFLFLATLFNKINNGLNGKLEKADIFITKILITVKKYLKNVKRMLYTEK